MATEEIPCSEEERYYKLDNMLLSSCQYLRTVFARRWKLETREEWVDDEDHVQRFMNKNGKRAYNKALPYHKKTIKGSKGVGQWDLSLLCEVLRNFGEEIVYKTENVAVQKLKAIRNFLAHHNDKKISQDVYSDKVTELTTSLHSLGMASNDIAILIERSGTSSSVAALEKLNKVLQQAKVFLKKGQVDKAGECYSDAITIPSLLPVNLGKAYEKRAEFFLEQIKHSLGDIGKCENALLDATKAIELNDSSWMAHFLAAQCHRHKTPPQLSQAVYHYQRALALSPAQMQVKRDLDGCRVLEEIIKRLDHQNPKLWPMNLAERIANMESETGNTMNEKQFLEFKLVVEGSIVQGQDHVFRGHQHSWGWDVPINHKKASRHFAKAAKLKNAEGLYNLGLCYEYGWGVKQNVEEALRIYRQVAEMDPKVPGEHTPLKCNVGVACAHHSIGLLYENGIGVDQDYSEAAKWYKRGMENGVGNSANNLAIMHFFGRGIPQDKKMAELCWRQGIVLKDTNSPRALTEYYMIELEPEKASSMFQIGREMGNYELLKQTKPDFDWLLHIVSSFRLSLEPDLADFEAAHQLVIKGMTFQERLSRKYHYTDPDKLNLKKLFENLLTNDLSKYRNWGGKIQHNWESKENIHAIIAKANKGSITALNVLKTLEYSKALNELLSVTQENTATEKQISKIVDLSYNCATRELHLVPMFESNYEKLKTLLAKLFKEKCDMKGDDDMKIRFCFVKKNLACSVYSKDMYAVELLKEGIRRYPDNLHYYHLITEMLGCKREPALARLYAEKGLTLFPDNADLLYFLAVHHRHLSEMDESIVANYQVFLNRAPEDHRKVPEAYYQIAGFFCAQPDASLQRIETYYQKGLDAEQHQLPCYLPYGCSDMKFSVENTISTLKKKLTGSPVEFAVINIKFLEDRKNVLERKPYLKSPTRKGVITFHRNALKESVIFEERLANDKLFIRRSSSRPPKLEQTRIKSVSTLQPITVLEMNPTQDRIFQNRHIDLTIIDDHVPNFTSIPLIVEDENGDVIRLYIYNVDKTEESLQNFKAGCRIAIMNPYMRIGALDITNGLRNDEPNNIVYLEKVENMCRFCSEGNAFWKCAKCKRPYCSRECQRLDWRMFKHQLICDLKF